MHGTFATLFALFEVLDLAPVDAALVQCTLQSVSESTFLYSFT